jgi:hypothetical protein
MEVCNNFFCIRIISNWGHYGYYTTQEPKLYKPKIRVVSVFGSFSPPVLISTEMHKLSNA